MMRTSGRWKTYATMLVLLLCIPAVVLGGAVLLREKYAAWVTLCVAVLSCVPLLYSFERRDTSSKELIVLAVLVAISSVGRFVFAWLPGFKPVTAITVIVAIYFGGEAGFVVGSMSAVISDFYFGQGPWTPFQMMAWGLIGFLAGVLAKPLRKSRIGLCLYGALAGVLYSGIMDVWTALWADGTFQWNRYLAACVTALPFTAEYAVSNVVFLLLLAKPIGDKLERLQTKYGIFYKS